MKLSKYKWTNGDITITWKISEYNDYYHIKIKDSFGHRDVVFIPKKIMKKIVV